MMHKEKILVCYNSPVSVYEVYSGKPKNEVLQSDDMSETGFMKEIGLIETSLRKYFENVVTLAIDKNIQHTIDHLKEIAPDAVLNLVESVEGIASFEAYHAGIYELLGIAYTGNTPQCLGNCLHKERAKHLLKSYQISVPASMIWKVHHKSNKKTFNLRFPVIAKLLKEDASIGISERSVIYNYEELEKHIKFLIRNYRQDILIEEYIEGREFNIGILGTEALPISEISFEGLPQGFPKIVTYEGKWIPESVYYKNTVPVCPADVTPELKVKLEETALRAFNALGCRDYARVDIRLNDNGQPFVIEVNPNPDISTDAGFTRASGVAGYPFDLMLKKIVEFALERKQGYQAA